MAADVTTDGTSVLVVGAGPTGLVLASELVRRGVACELIDERPGPQAWDRATVIHPGSLEVFEALGIADRFLAAGTPQRGARIYSDGEVLGEYEITDSGSTLPVQPRDVGGGDRVDPRRPPPRPRWRRDPLGSSRRADDLCRRTRRRDRTRRQPLIDGVRMGRRLRRPAQRRSPLERHRARGPRDRRAVGRVRRHPARLAPSVRPHVRLPRAGSRDLHGVARSTLAGLPPAELGRRRPRGRRDVDAHPLRARRVVRRRRATDPLPLPHDDRRTVPERPRPRGR